MRYPWANTVLLILLAAQLLTGVGSLLSGAQHLQWVIWLHILGAYAVGVLLFWKGAVIVRAIRRRPALTFPRAGFLMLTLLLLMTMAAGFYWSYSGPYSVGGFTLITVHGFLAVILLLVMSWHVFVKRFIFRAPRARDRRAFLRFGTISIAGLVLLRVDRPIQDALRLPGASRRFTGSYETGSLTGIFPHVSWLFDNPAPIATQHWKLRIDGAVARSLVLSSAELQVFAGTTVPALLDCTGGWYSIQEWTGIPVNGLLEMAGLQAEARSVTVISVTGYARRFSLDAIQPYLLATHVAGQALDHGHGFPLRLVAPGRRGFEWVKWVTHLRINTSSAIVQSPLPLQ